tara:strand:+ start:491 stop:895 length:405 start_codon:yes stop_codon:yes gene_type:complete
MKILGIEHIGIALEKREKTSSFLKDVLELENGKIELVKEQKVLTEIYDTGKGKLELLEKSEPDSPISRFLKKRGDGVHHIALEVDNLDEWLKNLKQKNVQLIDSKPRIGAENYRIAFIHPKATGGILVELCQKS